MEFLLLALALVAAVLPIGVIHAAVLVVHIVAGIWLARRLAPRQPMCALFTLAYVAMYFPNPLLVNLNVIPYDLGEGSLPLLYKSDWMLMVGFDLFLLAALRLRFTSFDAWRMPRVVLQPGKLDLFCLLAIGVVLTGITGVVLITGADDIDVFTMTKGFRASTGVGSSLFLVLSYISMVMPLVAVAVAFKPVRAQIPVLLPLLTAVVLHFLIFRVRNLPVAVCVAYGVGTLLRHFIVTLGPASPRGRLPSWLRMAVVIGLPALAMMIAGIKYLRMSYELRDMRLDPERVRYIVSHTFEGGDMGYAVFMRHALRLYPSPNSFLLGQSYYRVLFTPIPRFVWPDKPDDTQRLFAIAIDSSLGPKGVTIPAGIVGDLYINFGTLGVVGMLVIGLVFAQERYRTLTDLLYLGGSGIWLFHFVRGAFSNGVVVLLFVWFLSYLTTRFLAPRYASRVPPAVPAAPWRGPPPLRRPVAPYAT